MATEKRNMSRNEHKELVLQVREREREAVLLQRGKESRKQTGQGAGRLRGGALEERGAVQGELLKALGGKHNTSIEINHVPLAPSRAQRHSPGPDSIGNSMRQVSGLQWQTLVGTGGHDNL